MIIAGLARRALEPLTEQTNDDAPGTTGPKHRSLAPFDARALSPAGHLSLDSPTFGRYVVRSSPTTSSPSTVTPPSPSSVSVNTLQIERYRTRYQIDPQEPTALGQEPEPGSHTRQQRDELEQARAQITLAATRLHTPDHHHDVRAIEPASLARPALHRGIDRGGWGMGL